MRKKIFIVPLVVVFVFGAYWVKCQLGVDLIKHFAWEKEFPVLNILQKREIILHPKPGEAVLRATFEESFPNMPWSNLWSRDENMVERDFVRAGRNGSKCLLITSQSSRDWSLNHHHVVDVMPGQVFAYAAQVRTDGEAEALLGVTLYDADKHVVHWNFAAETVRKAADWHAVLKTFTVPEGTHYIRFCLNGAGIGRVWFEDMEFRREK